MRPAAVLPVIGPLLRELQEQAECNWLREHEPALWARSERFGLLSAFLVGKLSGRFVDSAAAQVGYLPFDFRRQNWAKDGHWMWQALCVTRAQLPTLVPSGGVLGQITAAASAATGIPAGLPLISAGADKCCEALGSGSLSPQVGSLSYGTTATINQFSHRYVEPLPLVPAYPAAVPGAFCLEQMVPRGYWMVEWFKRELGASEVSEAAARGVPAELLLERLLEATPAGAMGLMLQPYWSPRPYANRPAAKGALIGFGDVHGRAHIYRALIEGIAYELRAAGDLLQARTGQRLQRLRVAGGGARSDAVLQITADVFGLPVERPHVHEASALGAAINAAVGLGLHPDYQTAVDRMVHVGHRCEPRSEAVRTYDALYRQVYGRLYPRLAPLYRRIRDITGYPA